MYDDLLMRFTSLKVAGGSLCGLGLLRSDLLLSAFGVSTLREQSFSLITYW